MKTKIMDACMNVIKSSSLQYDEERLEVIEYGLESIYILITKTFIIFAFAYLLGIWKELLILLLIYNLIRMPSFGLHATKSIYCLVGSLALFFWGTYTALYINIPLYLRSFIGIYCILRIYKNAPADTYKRPIINQKRRNVYKIISTLIAIILTFSSLFITDMFIRNACVIALFIQVLMISPYVYKLFHLPYDNYKSYSLNQGLTAV